MAAGIDIPSSGKARTRVPAPLPHIPLFVEKAVQAALSTKAIAPTDEQIALARDYAKRAGNAKFRAQKETQVRNVFFDEVLTGLLGYKGFSAEAEYSLAFERMLRRKPVDVALGRFFPDGEGDHVLAPFEMKGPDTPDLDKIMPGRGVSPVQQAWDYAADAPGAKWVLVSNCLEIRLYRLGRGREAYERFDLTRLGERSQLERLLLMLEARRLIGGDTEALLRTSDEALKDVTDQLYIDFRDLRGRLVAFLTDSADGPKLVRQKAIETAQKLLDRVIFIAFACGNRMLPQHIFTTAIEQQDNFDPKPVWQNVRRLFRWIDKGNSTSNPAFDVWPYNGGLFADDAVADHVVVPDHLAEDIAGLTRWDYGKEVSVNVLGHIFEQSIGDIEKLREGEPIAVSQRKREGVVYTPDHVTRFLVERTIGETLAQRFADLLETHTGTRSLLESGDGPWPDEASERPFWRDYLATLRDLTIVDPACGSGAFLVAAFDALAAEYRRVTERLADLGEEQDFDSFDEILSKNLYGVDLNVESAEITRLALWLKTARRKHRLAKLDHTIRAGNSLIDDAKAADRPFDWQTAFPEVFERGGFDIVIGNPPYVRMEHLKAVKPWLAEHYTVADERTDLSAYFFEKGVRLLKTDGRLGYISTSSFFRAGYGERLRLLLGERTDLETVVDFGDAQIFEGVTTYPAILTMRKKAEVGPPQGELRFLNIVGTAPGDIGTAFAEDSVPMPRARLTGGSWQFEDDSLASLRDKIVTGRKTLGEVYGAPLYGIKTGLNEAFVIDTETRDRLVTADAKSAELLKPFLKGENIKRWRVEPEGLWLINTPRGKVDIDAYPAVRDWLLPFKDRLEARATQQEWWELQQAQLAYQPKFEGRKVSYPHFQNERMFTVEETGAYSNDKSYFIPDADYLLLGFLNSTLAWSFLTSISPAVRNGWHELRVQYVEKLPIPDFGKRSKELAEHALNAFRSAHSRLASQDTFHHRLLTDLATPGAKLSRKLENFHELDFSAFRAEVKRALKADIAPKERGDWEALHADASAKIQRLSAEIAAAEREIDRLVYAAFDLTPEEIALLEQSLERQV
ncbi:DNA methyltransferase [Aurantimonas sp. E1-2-R+4]|uniref:Eco57I restriction-modification methylase domain-containing protein n=1 Tax=Aurantimonas sp. E1-2-R+4 TaxID=3113714 RepID=UPI002F946ECE